MNILDLSGALSRGAGVDISVKGYSTLDLHGLAGAAKKSGALLTLRDANLLKPLDVMGLSGAGGTSIKLVF